MIWGRKNEYFEIIDTKSSQILFVDQEEIYITGYRFNLLKKSIFYGLTVLFFGIPALFLKWYPQLIYLKCVRSHLDSADCVLIKEANNNCIHLVYSEKINLNETAESFQKMFSFLKYNKEFRYFIHKDMKYVWLDEKNEFHQIRDWNENKTIRDFLEKTSGYTYEEQKILLRVYGKNKINIIIPNLWKVFFEEILKPFYLFQLFSVILWLFNDYHSYAVCVVVLSTFSILFTLYSTRKQKISLQKLATKSTEAKVTVVRKNGIVEETDSDNLVPGDVIHIPQNGCTMPCDALLLHGNCIVNEYTLTGESCPVTKTPPTSSDEFFNPIIFKRHILFCGTQVLQTRYYGEGTVSAVIINTGFSTIKGELIRCLLHPKPLGFKFHEDSVKFVFCLFFVAACGISYFCHVFFKQTKIDWKTLILDSLDLITVVVPPALPAALSVGIAHSRSRLLSKGIFCISPPKINMFGKLKLMCFDKTGTLTEEGFDLWAVLCSKGKKFQSLIHRPSMLDSKHHLTVALASCHSLTVIKGKLSGDPLDLSMFNSVEWDLSEPGSDNTRYDLLTPTIVKPKVFLGEEEKTGNLELPYEIGIVRVFTFNSANRCMSVITRQLGSHHMNLYCKGAPEKIRELCLEESMLLTVIACDSLKILCVLLDGADINTTHYLRLITKSNDNLMAHAGVNLLKKSTTGVKHLVPENFELQLQSYASMGFRVIGVAYKEFDHKFTWRKAQRVEREQVENQLIFLGLILMQNKLKSESANVMGDLRAANIRCVMVTGDNLLTALSVSRDCKMVLPQDFVIEVKVSPPGPKEDFPSISFQYLESKILKTQTSMSSKYHYALEGKTWELLRTYFRDLIPKIIVKGTIFARMLPEQKTQLVEAFQDLDYIVGMCGNGANDYGAMKVAHVGVCLSEAESSVVAPFTCKTQDVSCIVSLVQEGRCALISTFVIFKYMTIYSLIQFISVLLVYEKRISFGNVQFLYIDLIVTSLLAVVIGRSGPSKGLIGSRPTARLMSFGNLFPLLLQVLILFSVQMSALEFLYKQEWFIPVNAGAEEVTFCWENTVVYCVSLFQYLILALVYSRGKSYRQPFYKNVFFMIVFIVMTGFAILLLVWPFQALADIFGVMKVENDSRFQTFFRLQLLIFPLVNLILSLAIEISLTDEKWLKYLIHFVTRKKESKNKYKRVLLDPDSYLL